MAELKTKKTDAEVEAFLQTVEPQRRADCRTLLTMMREITGKQPAMWGTSIVGFGAYHYVYASGREGDWFVTGFSPRKQDLTVYIMPGLEKYESLSARLGKHKSGKSCLYIKRLADIDPAILKELIARAYADMKSPYGN